MVKTFPPGFNPSICVYYHFVADRSTFYVIAPCGYIKSDMCVFQPVAANMQCS